MEIKPKQVLEVQTDGPSLETEDCLKTTGGVAAEQESPEVDHVITEIHIPAHEGTSSPIPKSANKFHSLQSNKETINVFSNVESLVTNHNSPSPSSSSQGKKAKQKAARYKGSGGGPRK